MPVDDNSSPTAFAPARSRQRSLRAPPAPGIRSPASGCSATKSTSAIHDKSVRRPSTRSWKMGSSRTVLIPSAILHHWRRRQLLHAMRLCSICTAALAVEPSYGTVEVNRGVTSASLRAAPVTLSERQPERQRALDVAGAAQSLWHYELDARQDNKRLDLTKPNRSPSGRPIDRLRSSAAKRCLARAVKPGRPSRRLRPPK